MQKSRDSNFFSFLSVNYKTAELPKIVFLFLELKLNLLHKTQIWFLGYLFSMSQPAAPTCIYKKKYMGIVDKFRCITFFKNVII